MEKKVLLLAQNYGQIYKKSCSGWLTSCPIKSYNLCEGTGEKSCLISYPSNSDCFNSGILLSQQSGVRVPNHFETDDLNNETRKFICESSQIQQTFRDIFEDNNQDYTSSYIGSATGAIRIHPSQRQQAREDGECVDYDPRVRPWYVSAITGPKIMIILFDVSKTMSSMFPGARFRHAIMTLQIIIETLNPDDRVGIVIFSKTAKTLDGFPTIVNATQNIRLKLKNAISAIKAQEGMTNYKAAVQLSLKMIKEHKQTNNIKNENQLTLFALLTDGYTQNDDNGSYSQVPIMINHQMNLNSTIFASFVYGVQQNIKYDFVTNLTNQFNGILFRIWEQIDTIRLIDKLSSFFTFVSENFGQKKFTWSEPYDDAFGFGKIMSVSIPIYVQDTINKIIGVASLDVLINKLYDQGYSNALIASEFRNPPVQYQPLKNTQTLKYLRCLAFNQSQQNCSIFKANLSSINNCIITKNVFHPNVLDARKNAQNCCGLTKTTVFTIIFSSSAGLVVLVVFAILAKLGIISEACFWLVQKVRGSKPEASQKGSQKGSVNSITNPLFDPEQKYKRAAENGIRIYDEDQFCL